MKSKVHEREGLRRLSRSEEPEETAAKATKMRQNKHTQGSADLVLNWLKTTKASPLSSGAQSPT